MKYFLNIKQFYNVSYNNNSLKLLSCSEYKWHGPILAYGMETINLFHVDENLALKKLKSGHYARLFERKKNKKTGEG